MTTAGDSEDLTFVGSQGHRLAGVLHRPATTGRGSILLAHCFTCSKDLHTVRRLAIGLAEAGYAALRFDFTGLGESEGDFSRTSISANVSDLTRAATALIERGFGPCGLIGHSLGGAAAVLAAHRLKTVRSLVTIGAPADTAHITHLFADQLDELKTEGRARITIAQRSFELDGGFVEDLERHVVTAAVAELGRPYCIIHARDDDVVGFDNALELFEAAAEPRRLVELEHGGHLLTAPSASRVALAAIVDWFDETL